MFGGAVVLVCGLSLGVLLPHAPRAPHACAAAAQGVGDCCGGATTLDLSASHALVPNVVERV
eukprot:4390745-Amphidinium_carterae.1